MKTANFARARRAGFTLIEMIVVITILVILTGMIVARLDVFEMKANKAVSAASMADVARFLQTYRTVTTTYPDGWDSLVVTGTGTLPKSNVTGAASGSGASAIPANTPGVHGELTGGPPFAGSPVQLATRTLSTNEVQSLGRMGISTLYDFPAVASWNDLPGNMATVVRPIDTTQRVATLNYALLATASPAPATNVDAAASDAKALSVLNHIYPGPNGPIVPANKSLVVFGLGRFNQMVGSGNQNSLMAEAPFYPNQNQTLLYNRYLVVFEVDAQGSRARQVAVLGSDGDPLTDEVADFYQQNP